MKQTLNAVCRMTLEMVPYHLPHPADFEQSILRFLQDFTFRGAKPSLNHIAAISGYFSQLPYENISKIIKNGHSSGAPAFRLPDELTEDHYAWHLGGTCFSMTYFLAGIYTILGYQAQPLICDLNWGKNNHSAIMISFAGNHYLVDPGYMIYKPLLLKQRNIQSRLSADTGLSLRFQSETETYALFAFRNSQFVRRYQFSDQAVPYTEFSKFWQASFDLPGMKELTLTRVIGLEMTYIQGDFVKITNPEHVKKLRESNWAEQLIRDRFQIPLEKVEAARHILLKYSR